MEDSRRPERSCERAISCSSLRWRREIRDSERVSRVSMAGSSSSARERWAAWRVVEGVSSKCCGGVGWVRIGFWFVWCLLFWG